MAYEGKTTAGVRTEKESFSAERSYIPQIFCLAQRLRPSKNPFQGKKIEIYAVGNQNSYSFLSLIFLLIFFPFEIPVVHDLKQPRNTLKF